MVFEDVQEILSDHLKIDAAEITMDSSIADDLKMDSLDLLDLDMLIEDKFGVKIEDMEGAETVGDIVTFIEKNQK